MGKIENRQNRILTMLNQYGRLTVAETAAALNTSEVTIRRYFCEMENKGLVMRIFGGVCLPNTVLRGEYRYGQREMTKIQEKRFIGKVAANCIVNNDRIFFDSGTTVRECGNFLAERLAAQEIADIHIVTNSLVYSDALPQHCNFNLIGGTIRPHRMDMAGMAAMNNISGYRFSKIFLGADGISAAGELFAMDEEASLLNKMAISRCDEVYILADADKLGVYAFSSFGTLRSEKYTLITDSTANEAFLNNLRAQDIRIIIAG